MYTYTSILYRLFKFTQVVTSSTLHVAFLASVLTSGISACEIVDFSKLQQRRVIRSSVSETKYLCFAIFTVDIFPDDWTFLSITFEFSYEIIIASNFSRRVVVIWTKIEKGYWKALIDKLSNTDHEYVVRSTGLGLRNMWWKKLIYQIWPAFGWWHKVGQKGEMEFEEYLRTKGDRLHGCFA